MTSDDRDRLIGQVAQGAALRTACDCLGVRHSDLLDTLSDDSAFAMALLTTLMQARAVERAVHGPG